MGQMTENLLGKILFGVLFTFVLPFAAILWAIASDRLILLPAVQSDYVGIFLIILTATNVKVAKLIPKPLS